MRTTAERTVLISIVSTYAYIFQNPLPINSTSSRKYILSTYHTLNKHNHYPTLHTNGQQLGFKACIQKSFSPSERVKSFLAQICHSWQNAKINHISSEGDSHGDGSRKSGSTPSNDRASERKGRKNKIQKDELKENTERRKKRKKKKKWRMKTKEERKKNSKKKENKKRKKQTKETNRQEE